MQPVDTFTFYILYFTFYIFYGGVIKNKWWFRKKKGISLTVRLIVSVVSVVSVASVAYIDIDILSSSHFCTFF